MIDLTVTDVDEVGFYVAAPAHTAEPARPFVVFRTAQGDRVRVELPGVATAAQLREAGAKARAWHLAQAEAAYRE